MNSANQINILGQSETQNSKAMEHTNAPLRSLKDSELESSFHTVVRNERKIMHLVIEHIQEVSRRKLHLAKGFPSLRDYLMEEMKYSSSAAQRRIEAARLVNDVPSVAAKIESGEINLSQITELQKAVKESEKIHQKKVTPAMKAVLVDEIMNLNTSESQQFLTEALDIPSIEHQTIKTQQNNSKRVEFTFTEEQFAKFEKLRDHFAHKNFQAKRTQNMNDVLETLFDELLAKHFDGGKCVESESEKRIAQSVKQSVNREAPKDKAKVEPAEKSVDQENERFKLGATEQNQNAASAFTEERASEHQNAASAFARMEKVDSKATSSNQKRTWKSLTPKRKQAILREDKCCQCTDYESGRTCGTTFNLHVDHIIPKHAGGSDDPNNLRVLCREHNLFRYADGGKRSFSLYP